MNSYPPIIRKQARHFRSQGMTYREICNKLQVKIPKGTMSYWVSKIQMPGDYYKRVAMMGQENIYLAQAANKQNLKKRLSTLRIKNIDLINRIDISVAKLLLATFYWCEGAKYPSHRGLQFGSSDPKMISVFLTLLRRCYELNESKFRLTILCRADQKSIFLSKYWQNITSIPLSQHYQPRIDKRSINVPTTKKKYKGVCRIDYFDTNLQCELQFLGGYLGTGRAIEMMKNQIK